jgi:hypothetical protein
MTLVDRTCGVVSKAPSGDAVTIRPEQQKAALLIGTMIQVDSDQERDHALSEYDGSDEELLEFAAQLTSELEGGDDEPDRVMRKVGRHIVVPMLDREGQDAERWHALGRTIGDAFAVRPLHWELDRGAELVLRVAGSHIREVTEQGARHSLALVEQVDVAGLDPDLRPMARMFEAMALRILIEAGVDDRERAAARLRSVLLDVDLIGTLDERFIAVAWVRVAKTLLEPVEDAEEGGDERRAAIGDLLDGAELTDAVTGAFAEAWHRRELLSGFDAWRLPLAYSHFILGNRRDDAASHRDLEFAMALAREAFELSDAADATGAASFSAAQIALVAGDLGDNVTKAHFMRVCVDRWEDDRRSPEGRHYDGFTDVHEMLALFHRQLVDLNLRDGDVRGAFEMALRIRARAFGDALSLRTTPPSRRVPKAVWQEAHDLWDRHDAAEGAARDRAQEELDALVEQIAGHDPLAAKLIDLMTPTLDDVLSDLEPGSALVVLVPLMERLVAFIAEHPIEGETRLVHLELSESPISDVVDAVLSWVVDYDEFRHSGPPTASSIYALEEQLSAHLATLADIVRPDRIRSHLGSAGRVHLVALHPLAFVPLHALSNTPLIDEVDVSYLPSPSFVGLPAVDSVSADDHTLVVSDSRAGTNHALPFARLEAAAVVRAFPHARVLSGDDATEGAVLDGWRWAAHMHLACHAEQNLRGLGKILLAHDDELDLLELEHVPSGLVFLSGCETGLSSVFKFGDEAFSFPSSLLARGTSAVVATLWRVEDRAAVLLALRFYELLIAGDPPARALRRAQAWLRDADGPTLAAACDEVVASAPPSSSTRMLELFAGVQRGRPDECRYRHPFYWAPFYLTGVVA